MNDIERHARELVAIHRGNSRAMLNAAIRIGWMVHGMRRIAINFRPE